LGTLPPQFQKNFNFNFIVAEILFLMRKLYGARNSIKDAR
jgi:hypothetical protein